jgi:prepilin-type processing-associated H-X9-DG protein
MTIQNQPIIDTQNPRTKIRKPIFILKFILQRLAIIALLYFGLVFFINRAYEHEHRAKCSRNLSCLGQAVMLYMADNKTLPESFLNLTFQCDISPEVYICPGSGDIAASPNNLSDITQKPGHCSYIYIAKGQTLQWMDDYSHILAYENPKNHDNEGAHVLYADGSVKWLTSQEISNVISELEAGFNPPRGTASTSPKTEPANKSTTQKGAP